MSIKVNSASIWENVHCIKCGWPVIHACCNDEFRGYKNADIYDWWAYCSNKGCENHEGEGIFQDTPEWIEEDK